MVTTRSRSGAAPKQPDPDIALQTTFSNQSLLAWASGSRKNVKTGVVRKPQTASILNLPLDLLAIIFSSCHPLSLLQLGRTCIDLKVFFHSQASKSIWIASRDTTSFTITEEDFQSLHPWNRPPNAGTFSLPKCPSYLSEPAYSAFLFDPTCSFCHEKEASVGTGSLTSRICRKCYGGAFVSSKELQNEWKEDADPRIYDILPRIDRRRNGKKPSKVERVYHKPSAQAIFERALQYDVDVKFNVRMMNAFYTKGEEEIKEREALAAAYVTFERAQNGVRQLEVKKKNQETEQRFQRNKASVILLMEQNGVDVYLSDIEDCPLALSLIRAQPEELNDENFASIKDRLIGYLGPIQEERRYFTTYYDPENVKARGILDDLRSTIVQPEGLAGPMRPADFMQLDTCKNLAANPAFINGEEEARQVIWRENVDTIRQEIESWVIAQEESILQLLQERKTSILRTTHPTLRHIYDVNISRAFLRMPYTIFTCVGCQNIPTTLAEVLVHNCYGAYTPYTLANTRRRLGDEGVVMTGIFTAPFLANHSKLQLNWKKTSISKNIYDAVVKAGGEAPTSLAALLQEKGKLTCNECAEGSLERTGTTVALSYGHHIELIPYSGSKIHRKFTYVLPEGGEADAANDDAPTSPQHIGYGCDSDEFESEFSFHA